MVTSHALRETEVSMSESFPQSFPLFFPPPILCVCVCVCFISKVMCAFYAQRLKLAECGGPLFPEPGLLPCSPRCDGTFCLSL